MTSLASCPALADKQPASAPVSLVGNGGPEGRASKAGKRKRGQDAASKSEPSPLVPEKAITATSHRQGGKAHRPNPEHANGDRSKGRQPPPSEKLKLGQAQRHDAGESASRPGGSVPLPASSASASAPRESVALGSNWARLQAELTAQSKGKGRPGRSRKPQHAGPALGDEGAAVDHSGPTGHPPSFTQERNLGGRSTPGTQGGLGHAAPSRALDNSRGETRSGHAQPNTSGHFSRGLPRPDTDGAQPLVESLGSPDTSAREAKLTKVVAMDCEMVGVGREGRRSILARVSLVNEQGQVLYDKFVRPKEKVKDFRTAVSGIRRQDLAFDKACDFFVVQKEVGELIRKRILVGHALHNDLEVLMLSHPRRAIRDTQRYKPFRGPRGSARSLKVLVQEVLHKSIQDGAHDSVEDARCALELYLHVRSSWERSLRDKDFAKSNKTISAVQRNPV